MRPAGPALLSRTGSVQAAAKYRQARTQPAQAAPSVPDVVVPQLSAISSASGRWVLTEAPPPSVQVQARRPSQQHAVKLSALGTTSHM